jgi:hypothetical protein
LQSFINRSGRFLGIARFVGILDAQNQFAAVMSGKEPIKQRRPRAADVEITGRRRRETDADF